MPSILILFVIIGFIVVGFIFGMDTLVDGKSHLKGFLFCLLLSLFPIFWFCISKTAHKEYEYKVSSIEIVDGSAVSKIFDDRVINVNEETGLNVFRLDTVTKVLVARRVKNRMRYGIYWIGEKSQFEYAIVDCGTDVETIATFRHRKTEGE